VRQTLAALDRISARAQAEKNWLDSSTAEDVHQLLRTRSSKNSARLAGNYTRGEAATNWWQPIFGSSSLMRLRQSARIACADQWFPAASQGKSEGSHGWHDAHAAMPSRFCFAFLLAHAEAFSRDLTRLQTAAAGQMLARWARALWRLLLPIDRVTLAKNSGFSRITANSLDAVSDRDFALDYLFALRAWRRISRTI